MNIIKSIKTPLFHRECLAWKGTPEASASIPSLRRWNTGSGGGGDVPSVPLGRDSTPVTSSNLGNMPNSWPLRKHPCRPPTVSDRLPVTVLPTPYLHPQGPLSSDTQWVKSYSPDAGHPPPYSERNKDTLCPQRHNAGSHTKLLSQLYSS